LIYKVFFQDMTDLNNTTTQAATNSQDHSQIQTKQIGKYKVSVIREKCISAASCVAIAPQVFKLDEENLAEIISQDGNDDSTKLLAAQSCPTAAVIVVDTQTGEQVWPIEAESDD
jgi:ferredoxin